MATDLETELGKALERRERIAVIATAVLLSRRFDKSASRWLERLHPRDSHGRWVKGLHLGPLPGDDDIRTYREFPKNRRGAYMVGSNCSAAAEALAAGEPVELNQPDEVATLINRLGEVVDDMVKQGKNAPNFDLCKVSVKGTNLFCVESHGIPRIQMPQLKGVPTKGSKADKLPRDKRGEVSVEDKFLQHLLDQGAHVKQKTVRADHLRATQRELNGAKTAGIAKYLANGGVIEGAPIMVSHDKYIVDGHHRWSAALANDVKDNHLGDETMKVNEMDMGIIALLAASKRFAREWGIPQAGVTLSNTGMTKSLEDAFRHALSNAS